MLSSKFRFLGRLFNFHVGWFKFQGKTLSERCSFPNRRYRFINATMGLLGILLLSPNLGKRFSKSVMSTQTVCVSRQFKAQAVRRSQDAGVEKCQSRDEWPLCLVVSRMQEISRLAPPNLAEYAKLQTYRGARLE